MQNIPKINKCLSLISGVLMAFGLNTPLQYNKKNISNLRGWFGIGFKWDSVLVLITALLSATYYSVHIILSIFYNKYKIICIYVFL